jgi:dTDP-4-amino-4,6-dideoxygalactose transaminase
MNPSAQRKVPYHRYLYGPEEEQAVLDVLRSGWLTTGSRVAEFEAAFSAYTGARHAGALTSCTAGLLVGLKALGIGPEDKVLTTPFSFAATANVVLQAGAEVVFADVDPRTLNLSPETVEPLLATHRPRALIVVHVAGHLAPMPELIELCNQYNCHIVEDCAHALGARLGGQHAGTFGAVGSFSFYPNKNITTGEGGMIVCADPDLFTRIKHWRNHGLDLIPFEREGVPQFRQYDVVEPGYKFNMNEIQGALGHIQLKRVEEWQARRLTIFQRYQAALEATGLCWLHAPVPYAAGHTSGLHLAIVRLYIDRLACTRSELMARIMNRGVQLSVSFRPIHLFSLYQRQGFRIGQFPNAETAYEALFSLPFYPALSDPDVEYVIDVVSDELLKAKR